MHEGRITGEISREDLTEESIMHLLPVVTPITHNRNQNSIIKGLFNE